MPRQHVNAIFDYAETKLGPLEALTSDLDTLEAAKQAYFIARLRKTFFERSLDESDVGAEYVFKKTIWIAAAFAAVLLIYLSFRHQSATPDPPISNFRETRRL